MGEQCAHCEDFVLIALARSDGVQLVDLDMANEWILVLYDDAYQDVVQALVDMLHMYGFDPIVMPEEPIAGGA